MNLISVEDLVALAEDTIKEHGETVDDISTQVDESVDFATFVEENESEVASADLRVKPEDDIKVAEENTKVAEDDTTQSVIPVLDTGISQTPDTEIPVPEVIPETELVAKEETAVAEADMADTINPVVESVENDSDLAIEKLETKPESSITSVTTDVPLRAVPRFTVQPSAEWAPESAYTAETIPGMKPFEEEMGNYQNEKAFLYKDEEYSFAVNPGEEVKEEEKKETTIELAALEVNPFSSFLSEKEAKKVEAITNFKVEETVAEVVKASTSSEDIPLPEVIPQPKLAGSEETAVAVPVVEADTKSAEVDSSGAVVEPVETTNVSPATSKKSHGKLIGVIAGIAAAISAVFIAKQRKEK